MLAFRRLYKRLKNETNSDKMHLSLLFSTLTYFSPEFIQKIAKDMNFSEYSLNEINGLRYLYITYQNNTFVAFRGTEVSRWSNWRRILNFLPKRTLRNRKAHRGFIFAFDDCRQVLSTLISNKKDVIFCGHSFGGSMALLAAEYWDATAITFAAPKVFLNEKVYDTIKYQGYRIIGDFIPHLPFSFFFFVWSRAKPDYWISTNTQFYINFLGYHRMGTYIDILLENLDERSGIKEG